MQILQPHPMKFQFNWLKDGAWAAYIFLRVPAIILMCSEGREQWSC